MVDTPSSARSCHGSRSIPPGLLITTRNKRRLVMYSKVYPLVVSTLVSKLSCERASRRGERMRIKRQSRRGERASKATESARYGADWDSTSSSKITMPATLSEGVSTVRGGRTQASEPTAVSTAHRALSALANAQTALHSHLEDASARPAHCIQPDTLPNLRSLMKMGGEVEAGGSVRMGSAVLCSGL
ncbi:hypothetical protein AAT19DRAFT_15566 [Rhodotorula toruloides]|uniref:Uncharacterized protein n=1 Tax=Rhodotorula toruloides TaxID=5286 RepID=A0A2T0A7N1_RHOTO|nr:hypothetical protein AAT19DRAFT_15566 [Rhodotorula toruloides]